MCTSVLYKNQGYAYFGRNLDLQYAMGNEVVVTPRDYGFKFKHVDDIAEHSALVGMAINADGFPLYFEGFNEYGLGVSSLNFSGFAKYNPEAVDGKINLASFEVIPYLLLTCKTVDEVVKTAENMNITADSFSKQYQASPLHWMAADKNSSVVIEQTAEGLHVYENPMNTLTNQPSFPFHYYNFCNYLNLTSDYPVNRIAPKEDLEVYGTAMGSNGLPGGLSSVERFVRAAFTVANSKADATDEASLTQYFHIMQSVGQADGCDQTSDKLYEITLYTSGANLETMDFYWTTYNNQQINGLHTRALDLNSKELICFPVSNKQNVNFIN